MKPDGPTCAIRKLNFSVWAGSSSSCSLGNLYMDDYFTWTVSLSLWEDKLPVSGVNKLSVSGVNKLCLSGKTSLLSLGKDKFSVSKRKQTLCLGDGEHSPFLYGKQSLCFLGEQKFCISGWNQALHLWGNNKLFTSGGITSCFWGKTSSKNNLFVSG